MKHSCPQTITGCLPKLRRGASAAIHLHHFITPQTHSHPKLETYPHLQCLKTVSDFWYSQRCAVAFLNNLHSVSHPAIQASRHLVAEQLCRAQYERRQLDPGLSWLPTIQGSNTSLFDLAPDSCWYCWSFALAKGYTYLFTRIDRFTCWPKVIPMTDTTAESCASALLSGLVSHFGVTTTITSDRGWQFESALWNSLLNLLCTTCNHTTAYHPQANGMVERFHRHLKGGLKARLVGSNWINELPIVLLGIRSTLKAGLKAGLSCTSTKLVYGTHSVYQHNSPSTRTLPCPCQDCIIQCSVNSSFLHNSMDHLIPTLPLTPTPQAMSMSGMMPTSHPSPNPTPAPSGCSEDQTSI